MKLAKLSLAAIMTVGALSAVNAGSLEESIKGVDFSGFTRYRYYDRSSASIDAANTNERHRFSAEASLTAPIADNLTANITADIDTNDYAADSAEAGQDLRVQQLWFKYANPDYSFKLGKQAINVPVSYNYFSVSTGNGATFMYTGVENMTFVAAGFADTDRLFSVDGQENLYAAAAIGSFGSVNAQLWGFKLTNVVDDEAFLQVDGKVAGLAYTAQYAQANLTDSTADTQTFMAAKLGYSNDTFGINGGYIVTGEDGGFVALAGGDSSGLIAAGINAVYEYTNMADASVMFVDASTSFGKFGLAGGYVQGSLDKPGVTGKVATTGSFNADGTTTAGTEAVTTVAAINDYEFSETWVKVSYAVAKNFNTSLYYADIGKDADSQEMRFEAKYSF